MTIIVNGKQVFGQEQLAGIVGGMLVALGIIFLIGMLNIRLTGVNPVETLLNHPTLLWREGGAILLGGLSFYVFVTWVLNK